MEDNNVNIAACEDVVVEILCRLPGKDLIRCKCICRAWHHLICEVCIPRVLCNPPFLCLSVSFVEPYDDLGNQGTRWFKHLDIEEQESNGPPRFIVQTREGNVPFRHSTDHLLDSCNGLLLFHVPVDHQYYVCNPTTKEVVMLPEGCNHVEVHSTVLAFNPRKSPQYKVVRFAPSSGETHVVMDIYSSESGRWSSQMLPLDNLVPYRNWYKHAVFFDGTIYRLSSKSHLVCFDLNVVVSARIIGIPGAERKIGAEPGVLGSSMGYLCYAKLFSNELNVWFLNDQCKGGQWILKYRVTSDLEKEVPQYVKHPFYGLAFLGPFGFHPSSDVVFIGTPRMILSYDFKSNTLTEVFRIAEFTTFIYPVYPRVQCLVALANTGSRSL